MTHAYDVTFKKELFVPPMARESPNFEAMRVARNMRDLLRVVESPRALGLRRADAEELMEQCRGLIEHAHQLVQFFNTHPYSTRVWRYTPPPVAGRPVQGRHIALQLMGFRARMEAGMELVDLTQV